MSKDLRYTFVVIVITVGFILVATSTFFLSFASQYSVLASFLKFFFLASIGDVIGQRFQALKWTLPPKLLYKAIIWGLIGVVIFYMFQIFPVGITALQEHGYLPWKGSAIANAFFISFSMNLTFAPTMMAAHRISDTYLNESARGSIRSFKDIINHIDWGQFFTFTVFKTIPLFWIPAHTITFLLPAEYRIIFAAVLGIVLGVLLSIRKRKK